MPPRNALLASVVLLVAPCAAQVWQPVPMIQERWGNAGYDPDRARTVYFHGSTYTPVPGPGHTHEWDGTRWHLMTPRTSPSARSFASMAFCPVRRTLILFGGQSDEFAYRNDTWEWDGVDWRQVATTRAPAPRSSAMMCTDWANGRIILFGGQVGLNGGLHPVLNDETWIFDGQNWSQQFPATSPRPRSMAGFEYHVGLRMPVLVGGTGGFGWAHVMEVWGYHGGEWRIVMAEQPGGPPKSSGRFVRDPLTQGLLWFDDAWNVFSPLRSLAWQFDGSAFHGADWMTEDRPGARERPIVVADTARNQVMLCLGLHGGGSQWLRPPMADTWILEGRAWRQAYHEDHSNTASFIALDPGRGEFLFQTTKTSPFHTGPRRLLELRSWNEETGFRRRYPQTMLNGDPVLSVYDPVTRCLIALGTRRAEDNVYEPRMHAWDGSTWRPLPDQVPVISAAVFDPVRSKVVAIGVQPGIPHEVYWEWSAASGWSVSSIPPRPESNVPAMAFDTERNVLVLWGPGRIDEWNGSQWTRISLTGYGIRVRHDRFNFVYVPFLGGCLMTGQRSNDLQTEDWLWTGTHVRQLQLGLRSRVTPILHAYDPSRQVVYSIASGGLGGGSEDFHYTLRAPPYVESDRTSLTTGSTLDVNVDLRRPGAGGYLLAFSDAAWPGIPILDRGSGIPETVPLRLSPLLSASLAAPWVGAVDGNGRARTSLPIPNDPSLRGAAFVLSGIGFDGASRIERAFNPVSLQIVR